MIKILSMMKRKDGMSIQDFRKWMLEEHAEFGKQFPGIKGYKICVVTDDAADGPYDAVNELYFDDLATFQAALATDIGAQAGADIKEHCAPDRFRLVTEESIIVS
jgi:uncharacterized protein (TIGR02118 family)